MTQRETYEATFPLLYRFFYYKYLGKQDIEDLCQESFYRFFHKYPSESLPLEDCKKLLYTIARNVYREWAKAAKGKSHYELNEELDTVGSYTDFLTEEEAPTDGQARIHLETALATLQPVVQSVIRLRFIDGLSRREVAEKLAISEDHVHTYQKRGVRLLQKIVRSVPPVP